MTTLLSTNSPQMEGPENPMSISCPECRHILTCGRKCHQPTLRGQQFCTHHCHTRNLVEANRARKHSIALPPLEDRQAIQMAIDVVLAGLGAGKINRRTAATYAYAIKISSDNLARIEQEPPVPPIEIVRTKNGDILATSQSNVILSDRSAAQGVEEPAVVVDPAHPFAFILANGWETTNVRPTRWPTT